jgi:hypothetical protein
VEPFGLSAGQAGLAFGVTALAVTALYLLRLRRRRVEVASIALWREVLNEARSSELFARLTRWGSWLLALALVAALIAAVADPRPASSEPMVHVLVLDASLSMQATDASTDAALSRFDAAIAAAHRYVDRLPEGDAALVVTLAAHPSASASSLDPAQGHEAVDAVEVTDTAGDAERALALALDAAASERSRIVLFTDGAWSISDAMRARIAEHEVVAMRLSERATEHAPPNLAITALAARPHPLDASRAEVLLEVQSFADTEVEIEVRLDTEGRALEVLRLTIPPRERVRRFFTDLTGLDRTLEAHLSVISGLADGASDALPGDDHAYARIAERSRQRIAVVSRDNAYLEAALLLDEALEVTDLPPNQIPDASVTDVAIFDDLLPETAYGGPAIYLHPDPRRGGVGPLEVTGDVDRPRFDVIDDEHPLMRWLSLRNVNVGSALRFVLTDDDARIAGDEDAPLLVAGERDGVRFVALAFDVQSSDLPLRIAWPVLLLDAIAHLTPHEERDLSFARAGQPFSVGLPAGATEASLQIDGEAVEVPVLDGRASVELSHAGLHPLRTDAGERLLAVSPATGLESDLTALGPIDLGSTELGARVLSEPELAAPRPARHLWEWLALFALGVLVIEAVTYHRRWTV